MKLQALATVLLLASSVAFAAEPVKTDPPKSSEAVSTSSGSSSAGSQQSGQAAGRSRDAVRAEAVEAARNHRATLSESLDFLKN